MVKVYMIDDKMQKQSAFKDVLKAASALSRDRNIGVEFIAGFSDDVERNIGKVASIEHILSALESDGSIFLVDIMLQRPGELEQPTFAAEFPDRARKRPSFVNVVNAVDGFSELEEHLKPAAIIIKYLQYTAKPFLLVSLETRGQDIAQLERHLGNLGHHGHDFPLAHTDPATTVTRSVVTDWAEKLLSLVDPLVLVRAVSKDWFKYNSGVGWNNYQNNGLPHQLAGDALNDSANYRNCLNSILPIGGAEVSWWNSKRSWSALHSATKTFCGSHPDWMGDDPRYALSLAGVYWLFLLAVRTRFPANLAACLVPDWSCFFNNFDGGKARNAWRFVPRQFPPAAETSVRSIYEYFVSIITREVDESFSITRILWPTQDNPRLAFVLNWSPDNIRKYASDVNATIAGSFTTNPPSVSMSRGTTVGAYMRLLIATQSSKIGFGSFGSVRLYEDEIDESLVGVIEFKGSPCA